MCHRGEFDVHGSECRVGEDAEREMGSFEVGVEEAAVSDHWVGWGVSG